MIMPIKYDHVDRSVFDLFSAGNGQDTPAIDPVLSFHTASTHFSQSTFSIAAVPLNSTFVKRNPTKRPLATSPYRPSADLRPRHKAASRMTGVLRNLPKGEFTQLSLSGHPGLTTLATAPHRFAAIRICLTKTLWRDERAAAYRKSPPGHQNHCRLPSR